MMGYSMDKKRLPNGKQGEAFGRWQENDSDNEDYDSGICRIGKQKFSWQEQWGKFWTLEDLKNHLSSKIPTYQLFGCKYDSDDEDNGNGNNENGDN